MTTAQYGEQPATWQELYRQAFAVYGTRALWNLVRLEDPSPRDALGIVRQLRIEGNLKARQLAERLETAARAAL
jgi:hypothetical protein